MTNLSRKYGFCYKFVFEPLLFILKSKIFAVDFKLSRKLESHKVESVKTNNQKNLKNKIILKVLDFRSQRNLKSKIDNLK